MLDLSCDLSDQRGPPSPFSKDTFLMFGFILKLVNHVLCRRLASFHCYRLEETFELGNSLDDCLCIHPRADLSVDDSSDIFKHVSGNRRTGVSKWMEVCIQLWSLM